MLDVERRPDVDARIAELADVLPALGVPGRRIAVDQVRMREFVDQQDLGTPPERRVEVELLPHHAAVADGLCRQALERLEQALGLVAAMRLDVADDDVGPGRLGGERRLEHGVGLADAGRGAEEDPQSPAARPRLLGLDLCQQLVRIRAVVGHALIIARRRARGSTPARSRAARRARRTCAPRVASRTSCRTCSSGRPRSRATRGTWYSAAASEICGSRPLPEAVTRSTGTGFVLPGSAARSAATRPCTAVDQGRIQGSLVRAGRHAAVVRHRPRGRGPAPEILRRRERLPDQARADHLAVHPDEAAAGLVRETRPRPPASRVPDRRRPSPR